jgi:hypothetical protein
MSDRRLVAISCWVAAGGFPSERRFRVRLANGETYTSVAPRYFFWNAAGRLVGETEPNGTAEVEGQVAARRLEELADGQTLVEIPDGEVICVDRSLVRSRPTEITPNVPV